MSGVPELDPAIQSLVEAGTRLLRDFGNPSVDLEAVGTVSHEEARNPVIRVRVREAPSLPPTLILKCSPVAPEVLRHERVAMEFLGREAAALVPHLYAAQEGLLVLEDLGDTATCRLGDLLDTDHTDTAVAALHDLMTALARLHGVTSGRDAAWRDAVLVGRGGAPTSHRIFQIPEAVAELPALAASHGVRVPGLEGEVAAVLDALANPGPFLTFTHGDGTLANAFHLPEGTRFYDLETAGFRHALLDGVFAPIRYIHSVWSMGIPAPLRAELFATYRTGLARFIAQAQEDALFHRATAVASAGWLAGILRLIPYADKEWGRAGNSQRVLVALARFRDMPEAGQCLPALAGMAEELEPRLRSLLGDPGPMKTHPALTPLR